ncbi:MAG: hypothetical protein A2Y14_04845 [Verrucomicrobia bacterium GWF2_51_19]|nr:MAG: hypothetical protein A2Y14_04845 [Verrucomicrobia bacterium GWF2_51_19]HCJ11547.1 hypothetical protein [Opitutae bacterium]
MRPSYNTTVAFRGLWDRFAEPDSREAIERAQQKGFLCCVKASCMEEAQWLEGRSLTVSIFLEKACVSRLSPAFLFQEKVFAYDIEAQTIEYFRENAWRTFGCYLSLDALHAKRLPVGVSPKIVLFESENVRFGGCIDNDIAHRSLIREHFKKSQTDILKVSDLAEYEVLAYLKSTH